MRRTMLAVALLMYTHLVTAAVVTRVVPIFDEQLHGANSSVWQSEIHLYNSSLSPQTVTLANIFPYAGSTCAGFSAITVQPGELRQLRSIGCGSGAASLELSSDQSVHIDVINTNVNGIAQDPCCVSGFTTNVLISPAVYARHWTVANLQVPLTHGRGAHLGRHNLGIVNPGELAVTVTLRYFNSSGVEVDYPFFAQTYTTASVPPRTVIQLGDLFPYEQMQITPPHNSGFWRVAVDSTAPVFVYDSYVDNTTNDATMIGAIANEP